jgi:L-threonylcarbamoyladenylate synthase
MSEITGTDISRAAQELRNGNLVGIPTETVYGLAANALNADAVLKIYEAKGRPAFNPLIVHVHDAGEFEKYALDVPAIVKELALEFCPGPLTFVLPKKSNVPDIVTGGGDTVALRVPGHPLTLKLLAQLEFPLAAPSANPFGYISPVTAMHVAEQLEDKVSYILDGGPCMIGVESTVVMPENGKIVVLRVGGVPVEELERVVGKVEIRINTSSDPKSPGQLKSHYAPRIPLVLGNIHELAKQYTGKKIALLTLGDEQVSGEVVAKEVLSQKHDLKEAASNLFAAMRRLDKSDADIIIAQLMPDYGFGMAVNDRLLRASV